RARWIACRWSRLALVFRGPTQQEKPPKQQGRWSEFFCACSWLCFHFPYFNIQLFSSFSGQTVRLLFRRISAVSHVLRPTSNGVRDRLAQIRVLTHEAWQLAERHSHQIVKQDRKSTRLNSSHLVISYAVFCLKKK